MITVAEEKIRNIRTKKMLLWFAMISFIMVFAGLTSAYIVSKSRPDWQPITIPTPFFISTIVILASSLTYFLTIRFTKQDNRQMATIFLITTFILGLAFVYFQFEGYKSLTQQGLFPTGPTSTINTSFFFAIVFIHFLHLFGGLISMLVVIYNNSKQRYNATETLGLELSAMFWHFLDFLWIYLFLFLYFFK